MASLTLRLVKGSPLTNAEFDANFSNLNTDVLARLLASSNLADLTNAGTARANLGLGNVENKSSATIRGEISSLNVTTALGFTPYNATNPSGYITSAALASYLTSATAASTYQPIDADLTAIAGLAGTSGLLKKTAANTWVLDTAAYLTGITSGQVTTALGFTPYNATNPSGYITSSALSPYLTSAFAASTYQAILVSGTSIKTVNGTSVLGSGNIQIDGGVTSFNTRTGAVTLGSGDVTAALGFTPYDAANPSGFITSSALSPYLTSATAASTYQPIGAYLTGINSSQVTTALGFTPANKAGDTFTGAVLTSNAGGFTANSAAKLWTDSSRGRLDLYEGSAQTKSLRVMNANGYGIMGMTSAENLELWTNGVARLTLGGSGNVTASTNILVNNGTDSRYLLQVSGVTEGQFQATATAIRLSSNNTLPLVLATNGVDRLTFASDGLVTFGTSTYVGFGGASSASSRLRVVGTGLSNEVVRIENGTTSSLLLINQTDDPGVNANRSGISFRKNNVEGGAITVETNSTGRGIVYYDAAGSAGAHAFYVNSVDRLRLNASGALSFSGAGYGTAGQFLKTSGSSASPVWGALTSSEVRTALGFTFGPWGIDISGKSQSVEGLLLTSSSAQVNSDSVDKNQLGWAWVSPNLFSMDSGPTYTSVSTPSARHQIFGDVYDGHIAVRGHYFGNWSSWKTVLDSGNFTDYSPSLTGSGASGTWGISITGSAGSVVTRTTALANATSLTINCDTTDIATQANTQATGTLTINAPTGTPVNGQKIMLRLTCTNVQTFAWNAVFRGSTDLPLPTASSGGGKEDYLGFIYDSSSSKWDLIAKNFGF